VRSWWLRIPRNLVWSHQAKRWNFNSRWFHPEIFEVCGDRNHGIEHNQHRLKPWRQLPGAFYVGNGWVAGGCWDDDITNVMTGIIPSFRSFPHSLLSTSKLSKMVEPTWVDSSVWKASRSCHKCPRNARNESRLAPEVAYKRLQDFINLDHSESF